MENPINSTDQLAAMLDAFLHEAMRYDTDEMLRLLRREDLSVPRVAALNVVDRQGTVSISQISACLDLSLANTSMLVDKLVCAGFVTRAEDASDRRHKQIQLTAKGRVFLQDLRDARVRGMTQRMQQLPADLLDRAIAVLRDVVAQLPLPAAQLPERKQPAQSDFSAKT